MAASALSAAPRRDDQRHISLPAEILPDLREHLARFVGPEQDALLFAPATPTPSPCGHLSQDRMRSALKDALAAIGLADMMVPRDTRHWCATMVTALGFSQAEVMKRLGHKSPQTAARYQHAVTGTDAKIAGALGKLPRGFVS